MKWAYLMKWEIPMNIGIIFVPIVAISRNLNTGLGLDYWFYEKLVSRVERIHTYSDPNYDQLFKHFQFSTAYSLNLVKEQCLILLSAILFI
ncbi:MAG: hypothetical protein PSN34_09535 [Urechidicola sp.]|nr:hypothetical protein [Urechidicola sp.]